MVAAPSLRLLAAFGAPEDSDPSVTVEWDEGAGLEEPTEPISLEQFLRGEGVGSSAGSAVEQPEQVRGRAQEPVLLTGKEVPVGVRVVGRWGMRGASVGAGRVLLV